MRIFRLFFASFANNRHFYTFWTEIAFAIKRILPITALRLTDRFNINSMGNGLVFEFSLQKTEFCN